MTGKTLWIVRGLPNSGKSSVAKEIAPFANYAADDYFYQLAIQKELTYTDVWDARELIQAHAWCKARVQMAMDTGKANIAVHNVFSHRRHIKPYQELAAKYGYMVRIITVERNHDGDNGHNVPRDTVQRMAARWQHVDRRFYEYPLPKGN